MKWETVKLSDCCFSIADGDHQPPPKAETGVPFVTISNINAYHQFDFNDTMFVPQDYYDRLDPKRKAQTGDVLYSVVGSFGIPVLIKDDTPFVFQRHIAILRPNEKILSAFLYYSMLCSDFYAKADAAAIGAAQRTISLNALRNMEIVIPPIKKQNEIAKILSAYDDLIENNRKQIKLLEEAAQRLYKEWFIDLRFPGWENAPIHDGLPEGWSYRDLSDVFDFIRGKSYSSNELSESKGTLMVNLKNIRAFGGYNRNAEKRFTGSYKDTQILKPGDVIMGVTDMTKERRLVGHVALVPDLGEDMIFSMDLIKLVPKCVLKSYLYSTFFYGGFSYKISPLANGVNVLHLKPESMLDLQMLVPSMDVMQAYDQVFSSFNKRIDLLEKQMSIAVESRDRLLPKLMNQTLEVHNGI